MSITEYSRYRRMKLRAAWELAGMAVWCKEVGRYIAAFIFALILVQYITDAAIAEDMALEAKHRAERKQEHAEATWLSCLNHKGVYVDGRLHTCSLADTRFTQEHFK
jgi:hypothetical protein